MAEFNNFGRRNEIDFGDYVEFPYGMSREKHIWKVVSSYQSNTYMKAPYMFGKEEQIHSGGLVPVLNIIHCGIDETKVVTVCEAECTKINL